MSKPRRYRRTPLSSLLVTLLLLSPAAALAQAAPSAPDSAPASEVTSGQRVTGHTRTRKSRYVKTSPEQPAPATRQRVQPSQRLPEGYTQEREQVAPAPTAPVPPNTPVTPGQDVPTPHRA